MIYQNDKLLYCQRINFVKDACDDNVRVMDQDSMVLVR